MMASIRLFGRGKSTAGAGGGSALGAEQIAEVLADMRTASMSTTWRCRHGSGTAIGEGAVDFENRRSRATVIRGKYAFEYVRVGSSVYRAPILDDEVQAQLGAATAAASAKAAGAAAPAATVFALDDEDALTEDTDDEDADDEDDEGFDDDPQIEAEAEQDVAEGELDGDGDELDPDAAAADEDEDEAGDGDLLDAQPEKDGEEPARAWQGFSEHDACGVHAYAEPAVLAAGVRAAAAVTPAGRTEIDGAMLTGYSVTLKPKPADPDRLLARLARQLRDHGANALVLTAFVDDAQGASEAVPDFSGARADADADAGASDAAGRGARIVRLRLELAHWTPADDPTADHTVSVDLFEFGDPVRVEPPAAGSVTRRTTRSCADLALF